MKVDGACHCGRITFEAEVDPSRVRICHCRDCQTFSGSAFRVVVPVPEALFSLLTGSPKTYVKTAESGAKRIQAFCSDCGTSLYATSTDPADRIIGLRLGILRQRDALVPTREFWVRSRVSWVPELTPEQHETQ